MSRLEPRLQAPGTGSEKEHESVSVLLRDEALGKQGGQLGACAPTPPRLHSGLIISDGPLDRVTHFSYCCGDRCKPRVDIKIQTAVQTSTNSLRQ